MNDPIFIVNYRKSPNFLLVASYGNDARANTLYTQEIYGGLSLIYSKKGGEELSYTYFIYLFLVKL